MLIELRMVNLKGYLVLFSEEGVDYWLLELADISVLTGQYVRFYDIFNDQIVDIHPI